MATPAQIQHLGAPAEGAFAAPDAGVGTTFSPRMALLWNGVPLETIGIAEHLLEVEFTATVGRTKATTRNPTGKPKVGGARVTFHLADAETAELLMRMLSVELNPTLTIGLGYADSMEFWTAMVQAATKPDAKLKGMAKGFRMDTVNQTNDAGVQKLTISGMVDTAFQLARGTRPRVYERKTARQILTALASEYDIEVEVDPDVPADTMMSHAVKLTGETDLAFLTRIADRLGAHIQLDTGTPPTIGAANPYSIRDVKSPPGRAAVDRSRALVRLVSYGRFVDLSEIEASRPIVIGYGPKVPVARRASCDYMASSISVQMARFTGSVGGAAAKKDGTVAGSAQTPRLPSDLTYDARPIYGGGVSGAEVLELRAGKLVLSTPDTSDGLSSATPATTATEAPHKVVGGGAHAIDPSGLLSSSQIQAAALAMHRNVRLSVTLNPGAPNIQANASVEIVGTPGSDGMYMVEDTTSRSTRGSGLTTVLSLAPLARGKGGGKKRSETDKAGKVTNASGPSDLTYDARPIYGGGVSGAEVLELRAGRLAAGTSETLEALGLDAPAIQESESRLPGSPEALDELPDGVP